MPSEKKYYPQLDSIRGIAFLLVFIFHSYRPTFSEGIFSQFSQFIFDHLLFGLDIFFVLSSFLLTLLGLNEYEKTGKFSFKNYIIRRSLRIWPLYFLVMFFSFVILKMVVYYSGHQITLPPAYWYLFFISNFYLPDHVFFLRVLWTLSIEEQFYIFWGMCLLLFQKYLEWVITILAFISIAFIFFKTLTGEGIYFHTLTYVIDMMCGAFAAYSIKRQNKIYDFVNNLSKLNTIIFYSLLPFIFVVYFLIDRKATGVQFYLSAEVFRIIFIVLCSLIIIEQMKINNSVFNISKNFFLVYTGQISYGLYCFHGIVISFGYVFFQKINLHLPEIFNAIIFFIITYFIAAISYTYFEKPFLKLKEKLGNR